MAEVRARFGSAILMGGGLVLVGAAGYVFLAVAGHRLPPHDAAAMASFYLLVNIVGPGLFVALEQETSRATSRSIATGAPLGPVFRSAARLGLGLVVAVVLVLGAIAPVLVPRALTGHWFLFVDVLLAAVAAAGVYLVRGVLGGMRRFTGYAATLGGEGIGRLVFTGVLAVSGTLVVGYYGLFYGLATVVGAVAGLRWLRGRPRTEDVVPTQARGVPDSSMGRGLLLLLTATVLMQVAANVAPIVVTSRLTEDAVTASAFASAFVLVRIPLFVLSPVQAMLLPSLTAAAARGEFDVVRRDIRKIMVAVAVVGGLGVLASATVGPWAVQVLFGARTHLSGVLLGLLGVSTVLLMIAQVLQPALVALGMHRGISRSWLVGTIVLGGMLVLPGDPLRAAVIGQLTGPALVVIGMILSLRGVLRSSHVDPQSALADARTDRPGLT